MAFLRPRRQATGYGKTFAFLSVCTFAYLWPYLANYWWGKQVDIMREYDLKLEKWYVMWSLFQTFWISVLGNAFYGICYYFEFEFIE